MIDDINKNDIQKQLCDCISETDELLKGINVDSISPDEAAILSELKNTLEDLKNTVDLSIVNSKTIDLLSEKKEDLIKSLDKQQVVGLKGPSPFNSEG